MIYEGKILLIGYGSIGARHVFVLNDELDIPKSQIEIVTKQTLEDYVTYQNISEIDDLNIYNYIIISSATSFHYEQLAFLDEHVRNKIILVEKPIFDKYKRFVSKNNSIFVAYNLRFHPIIVKIKELLNNNKVYNVNVITGQYLPEWRPNRDYRNTYSASKEMGGGVLLDLSHEIDYLQWIFGCIVNFKAINDKISDLEITSDDFFTLIGKTTEDIIINLSLDYISKIPMRRIIINCLNKTIVGDFNDNSIYIKTIDSLSEKISFENVDRNYSYKKMHLDIIENKFENLCSINEGLEVLKIINAVPENQLNEYK